MRLLWGIVTVLAVLWPGRVVSPLDGVPLDHHLEAVLIGVVLPVVWWFHPTFLRTMLARSLVAGLLIWKLASGLLLTQQGWCAQFVTPSPAVDGGSLIQQSWDLRTDWGRPPGCSAVIARPYTSSADFPLWFTNLFDEQGRPPHAAITMRVSGILSTSTPGQLGFSIGQGMDLRGWVGSLPVASDQNRQAMVSLSQGSHSIKLDVTLSGSGWKFVPLWNGRTLWNSPVLATVAPPAPFELILWKVSGMITPWLTGLLLGGWVLSALKTSQPNLSLLMWMLGASVGLSLIAGHGRVERFGAILLFGSLLVPVVRSLRNLRGAMLLLGVPWLSFFVMKSWAHVGRFTLYSLGDDWLTFQRFAHRIFMEGYWLEGGEKTFWNQPLYRWISGLLHLVFGDSSIGEVYWDAGALLIGALFCIYIVKRVGGFRWGLTAGIATLATFTIGPIWYLIGRGLSEIAAAGWAYLAAFCLLRGRTGRWTSVLAAGVFAILMFYTRLNHLLFAGSLALFVLPLTHQGSIRWLQRSGPSRAVLMYLGCIVLGVGLFALRTWYYTGVFSVLYKTPRELLSTGLGPSTLLSAEAWSRALQSVWMVITVHDPGNLNLRGVTVTIGVLCALLALLRLPGFRKLPVSLSVACVGAVVGSLLVRGYAYPGRFSVHLVPLAVATSFCMVAILWRSLNFRSGI